jgi:hypothetical protein
MRRRQFIRGLGAAAAISSRGVHAQARQSVIGFFSVHSSMADARTLLPAFHTAALQKPVTLKAATSPLSTYGQTAATNASPPSLPSSSGAGWM